MKKLIILSFFLTSIHQQAQIFKRTSINAAYRYTGRNVIQGGLEYRLPKSFSNFIVGASVLYTSINDKAKFIPEFNFYASNLGLLGVSVNPYSIEPRFGFSFLNTIMINTGYAIPIHNEKYFKGITFGVQLNFPLTKNSEFYHNYSVIK
ncbi:hypothetical protein [Chryseobacterium arachidis]|uniref:hypothetical protein n=1 Tax=Chryseobacterium arachidis TaxID=1416778 RepID=UPI000934EF86|nr:hypothetical protein [Chryseobacterium arachidis]